MTRCVLAAVGSLGLAASAFGALTWTRTAVELDVQLGQEKVATAFPFKNETAAPVRIASVVTSCGCSVPRLPKELWNPGESGELKLEFDLRGQAGARSIAITVNEAGSTTPQTLVATTVVPEAASISSRLAIWERDAAPEAKVLTIGLLDPARVRVGAPELESKAFSARLERTEDPSRYRLVIQPRDTSTVTAATIRLRVEVGLSSLPALLVYAAVR